MKKITSASIVVMIVAISLTASKSNNTIPNGWYERGTNISEYEIGLDKHVFVEGNSSVYIKSKSPERKDFGNLMQTIKAEKYLNKRLRMTGQIKTELAFGRVGMWIRVDGPNREQLAFDNMQNRPVEGSTDWTKYEIVFDVPNTSVLINYGLILVGSGTVWLDDAAIEVVGNLPIKETDTLTDVTTFGDSIKVIPSEPVNLKFEE